MCSVNYKYIHKNIVKLRTCTECPNKKGRQPYQYYVPGLLIISRQIQDIDLLLKNVTFEGLHDKLFNNMFKLYKILDVFIMIVNLKNKPRLKIILFVFSLYGCLTSFLM